MLCDAEVRRPDGHGAATGARQGGRIGRLAGAHLAPICTVKSL
jgi:hypothetical protein